MVVPALPIHNLFSPHSEPIIKKEVELLLKHIALGKGAVDKWVKIGVFLVGGGSVLGG